MIQTKSKELWESETKNTNADIFAEWMRRQGYSVFRTTSGYWVESGPRVYQAIPYHYLISPSEEEISNFMRNERAIALRYSTPLNVGGGRLSYHVTYENNRYSQQGLHKKVRHDIKKGLSIAIIEPIAFSRLASDGWALRSETLARQGRSGAEKETWWRKLCLSTEGLPNFEAWGAIVQGKLVAALFAFICDDYFCILYHQSLTEYLPFGVNNALAYVVTAEILKRPEPIRIFYGMQSLDAPASVDEFKFRMGYNAKPVRQQVIFHPWLRSLFNPASHALLRGLRRVQPGNRTLAKTEGMIRFYLEGKKPLEQQTCPQSLLQHNITMDEK